MNEHAPGWYEHDGERRYWDGAQWTHSTSMPSTSQSVAPYAPPPQQGHYAPPPPGVVMPGRKEPGIALLLSFFIPGLGSMINGDVGAGIGFLCMYVFGFVLVICLGWILIGFIGLPLSLVAWGWSMYHAYQGAVEYNRLAGYPG